MYDERFARQYRYEPPPEFPQALPRLSKGNGVNIPQPGRGYCMAT